MVQRGKLKVIHVEGKPYVGLTADLEKALLAKAESLGGGP